MGYEPFPVIWPDGPTGDVLLEVYRERVRQDELKVAGRFPHTCADAELSPGEKLAVLVEEVGEVARALSEDAGNANDKHGVELRRELVQVAAVAVAWAESLMPEDTRGGR